jgi:hypothetical protein
MHKNGYPNFSHSYPTQISRYLPSSPLSVSDPNSKLHNPNITCIHPTEYKYSNSYPKKRVFALSVSVPGGYTRPFFTPSWRRRGRLCQGEKRCHELGIGCCSIPKIQILDFSQTRSKFKMDFKFHFKMFVYELISANKI